MAENDLTLHAVRDTMVSRLESKYSRDEARAIAHTIMAETLGVSQVDIALRKDREISPLTMDKINGMLDRIVDRDEPVQYVVGQTRFYGGDISVNLSVLIPRPETEELVDMIVDDMGSRSDLKVLDLCTGSGCIAVTLARVLKFASVDALDLSYDALEIARHNAGRQGVKVNFINADLLAWSAPHTYDIIVSNPPYILDSERASMDSNVLDWEPEMALFVPDDDPLLFYRPIAMIASHCLNPHGKLYIEINPLCADALEQLLRQQGLTDVTIHRDMSGHRRFITANSKEQ